MTSIALSITSSSMARILVIGIMSFIISMIITPIYTRIAYKYQWWKQQRTESWTGEEAVVYKQLHAEKHKRHIPTMAGLIFITAVLLVTVFYNLDRTQTWLPLAAMVGSAFIGLVDDVINIRGVSGIAGMRTKLKFVL